MVVYIVYFGVPYDMGVDKIFLSKEKAEAYLKESLKECPYYQGPYAIQVEE